MDDIAVTSVTSGWWSVSQHVCVHGSVRLCVRGRRDGKDYSVGLVSLVLKDLEYYAISIYDVQFIFVVLIFRKSLFQL
jgi:hypothetical protein